MNAAAEYRLVPAHRAIGVRERADGHKVREFVRTPFGGFFKAFSRVGVQSVFDLAFACRAGAQIRSVEECDGDDFKSRLQRFVLPRDLLSRQFYSTFVYCQSGKSNGTVDAVLRLLSTIRPDRPVWNRVGRIADTLSKYTSAASSITTALQVPCGVPA